MKKLNNLLNREEYLQAVNEGKIGDFLRKGVNKIKKAFSVFIGKIKNFIFLFDSNGDVLPVVTPQALGNVYNKNGNVRFFGTPAMNKDIKKIGGKGCETQPVIFKESEYIDDTPKGKDYFKWINEDGFKNTNYYKNLQTMNSVFESVSKNFEINKLNEKLEPGERIKYGRGKEEDAVPTGTLDFPEITSDEFKDMVTKRIESFCEQSTKTKPNNMLVFGAPGVGKSTIPKMVVEQYNQVRKPEDRIALISVNCSRLEAGDLMMPSFPKRKNVMDIINTNPEDYENIMSFLDSIKDPKMREKIEQTVAQSGQQTANNAPAPWLPCYRETASKEANMVLDMYANGGVFVMDEKDAKKILSDAGVEAPDIDSTEYDASGKTKVEKVVGNSEKTGSGGIILLDEFLRCDPRIFKQLLNFLLDGKFEDFRLGSKWFVMACSNRPCDSYEVEQSWNNWESADRDRWPDTVNYSPSPEEWKAWARTIGFDENLLKYIFDESTGSNNLIDGEYRRWHNMANKNALKTAQHKGISPRTWEKIMNNFFIFYERHQDEPRFKNSTTSNITSNMTIDEIKKTLGVTVSDEIRQEISDWFETHCGDFKLEDVIKDPVKTPMPIAKMASNKRDEDDGEKMNDVIVMNVLKEQMKERYVEGKNPKKITDAELSNIMIWLGINYKDSFNVFANDFANQLLPEFNIRIWDYHKFGLLFMAAFPEDDYKEVAEYPGLKEELCNKENKKTDFYLKESDDIVETAKSLAKQYFSWRINDDEFITIFDKLNNTKKEEVKPEEE